MRINNLTRKSVSLLAAFLLPALLALDVARSQDVSEPAQLPVDVMQVLELPVHLGSPMLLRSEQGYLFKCEISSNSEDRILGFTYQLFSIGFS